MIDEAKRALVLKELEQLVNRHCLENGSNTPDWILAQVMLAALESYDATCRARDAWYGRPITSLTPGVIE